MLFIQEEEEEFVDDINENSHIHQQFWTTNAINILGVQNQNPPAVDPPDQNSQRKKRLKEFSNSLIKENPKYIADNLYAIQIVQVLTNAGLCKISNFVNGHYQAQLEQIIKYDKHIQDSRQDSSLYKQIFFINVNPVQISFQDGCLVFKQNPPTLDINPSLKKKYQYLFEVINLTMRLLDTYFKKDFQSIIDHYINMKENKYSNNRIIEFLQNEIEKNAENYTYVSKWLEIKSKIKPVLVIYKQIKILEKKDELCGRKSLKVLSKHIKKIDKLQKRLYQEQILSPLEFLLTNLFDIFDSILKFYEENYEKDVQFKPQVVSKKNEKHKQKQLKPQIQEASVQECEQEQFQYYFQKKQLKQQEHIVEQFDCQLDVLSGQSQSPRKKVKDQKSE
ncbi:unnamed protein product (macronuclear) [Paramecium tetraurelia]|uniref:Uncharacterized protein n=1 Tax=Paramecium tetraurelia TaxID=5888 RepID=A0BCZ4_PARTE|nr:uncharacterized protein GSPATT00004505001 [Paramecium tetraurelia]CAK56411.1 unnamed protein product [Paramecium tetraurelia]|eukprot:XP_001423809.1 hypothetical protein (macronuclear) [Paramecium tetraurelia strain d4-2]